MRHTHAIQMRRRSAAGRWRSARPSSGHDLFHHAHAGRYFGGLWFKVFSERGPC